jgi:oligosaccharide repeat unit polymerase
MKKIKFLNLVGIRIYILHVVLFLTLLWVYQTFIVVLFSYQGYPDNMLVANIPFSLFLLTICLICIRRPGTPAYFFLHLGLSLVITPSLVLYCGGSLPNEYALTSASAFMLIGITVIAFDFHTIKFQGVPSKQLLFVLSILSLTFIGSLFIFGSVRFINFDLSRVYEFRRNAAENLPGIFGYLNSLFGKVVIPFGVVLSLLCRKWILVVILIGCSILLFALTGHKSPLFFPFMVLFIYWASQSPKVVDYLLIGILTILLLSSVDFWLYIQGRKEDMFFGSLFARRSIFVPSFLNWLYFDWFSTNEKFYWATSKITLGQISSNESMSIANLIGLQYFNTEDSSANTGWIGSGYANAGLFGVYLYSGLIGLFFSFLNAYGRKLGARLVIALFVLPVFSMLRSADLPTMLLTHGLLIAILLLLIIPAENAFLNTKQII